MASIATECDNLQNEYCQLECDKCGWNPKVAETRLSKKYDEGTIEKMKRTIITMTPQKPQKKAIYRRKIKTVL